MIELTVKDHHLIALPLCESGPLIVAWAEGKSWAATITGEKNAIDRQFWQRGPRGGLHLYRLPGTLCPGTVVEFGVNPAQRPGTVADDEVGFESVIVQERRRWYGVARDLVLFPDGSGTLTLVECEDMNAALQAAPQLALSTAPYAELAEFIAATRGGDLLGLAQFTDWLSEHGDGRGEIMRAEMLALVDRLFPECPKKKLKQQRKQVPATLAGQQRDDERKV